MFLAEDWEMFYTESRTGDDMLVDQISIDEVNKRFILDIDVTYLATDGYDDNSRPICSTYVSRFVFETIVNGVKAKGFAELIAKK